MGDRGAEEGQHAVTHQPRDRTLVAINRRNEALEGIIHNFCPILWIELTGHGDRPCHVTKEDGDNPPFPDHAVAGAGFSKPRGILLGHAPMDF